MSGFISLRMHCWVPHLIFHLRQYRQYISPIFSTRVANDSVHPKLSPFGCILSHSFVTIPQQNLSVLVRLLCGQTFLLRTLITVLRCLKTVFSLADVCKWNTISWVHKEDNIRRKSIYSIVYICNLILYCMTNFLYTPIITLANCTSIVTM